MNNDYYNINGVTEKSYFLEMEYGEIKQRVATSVDICPYNFDKPMFNIKAIWDTGATTSFISNNIANEMGLKVMDNGVVYSSNGQCDTQYYLVDVHLSDDIIIHKLRVGGIPLANHEEDFIIGMDIISKGNLRIENINGKTKLRFEYIG